MTEKEWLKQNIKRINDLRTNGSKLTFDNLSEAIINKQVSHLINRKAVLERELLDCKLPPQKIKAELNKLNISHSLKLKGIAGVGRATIFRFKKGEVIKPSTIRILEDFFEDKFPTIDDPFQFNTPNGDECELCNAKSHDFTPDLSKDPSAEWKTYKGRNIYLISVSLQSDKIQNLIPRNSKVGIINYSMCEHCIDANLAVLKASYSTLVSNILEKNNRSQSALANELEVPQSVISKIKANEVQILNKELAKKIHALSFEAEKFTFNHLKNYKASVALEMYGYTKRDYRFDVSKHNYFDKRQIKSSIKQPDFTLKAGIGKTSFEIAFYDNLSAKMLVHLVVNNFYQYTPGISFVASHFNGKIHCLNLFPLKVCELPFKKAPWNVRSIKEKHKYEKLDSEILDLLNYYEKFCSADSAQYMINSILSSYFVTDAKHLPYCVPWEPRSLTEFKQVLCQEFTSESFN